MVTPRIEYKINPMFVPDDVPVWLGNSKDSAVIYDATAKEWTVQTTNAAGALQDRLVVKGEQNDTHVIIPALAKLYLDGGGDTLIHEVSANVLRISSNATELEVNGISAAVTMRPGGSDRATFTSTALAFQQATTISTTAGDLTFNPASDVNLNNNNLVQGTAYHELGEIADPAAPGANTGRFYTKDNGSGKTQLAVRFATGAVQVIATEP